MLAPNSDSSTEWISEVASSAVLDTAFSWLCKRRIEYSDSADRVECAPLTAALYLEPLDRRLEATGLTYARFMDDWVILAPTRWSLRRGVRVVNQTRGELRVEQHPDKTVVSMGRRNSRAETHLQGLNS